MRLTSKIALSLVIPALINFSSSTVIAGTNLLTNPGFERGQDSPVGWTSSCDSVSTVSFGVDNSKVNSGKRSVYVDASGSNIGMWQQTVDVQPGCVYLLAGYVAYENVEKPGKCNLRISFLDLADEVVEEVNFPTHTGTKEDFAYDFSVKLKVRAPVNAKKARVNLSLVGPGKAWFDDIYFGLAEAGKISGEVTNKQGKAIQGVRVYVFGDPWGKVCEDITDSKGHYEIPDIPVAFPRYIIMAEKKGYKTKPSGDIEIKPDGNTVVNLKIEPGSDPDNLLVRMGSCSYQKYVTSPKIPDGAEIPNDISGYSQQLWCYLKSDCYIQHDHPDIVALAEKLMASVAAEERNKTRKVAWAICEWVAKEIDHDGVFGMAPNGLNQPFKDVTSGIWQTISGEGWCWGRNFRDWSYRPHELLQVHGGICIESALLVTALFRNLNVPARPTGGSLEFWAQTPDGIGTWVHMKPTKAINAYRELGQLGPGFEGEQPVGTFSVTSRPMIHEDWGCKYKGLWRELHPWGKRYQPTEAGYREALEDMAKLSATGSLPEPDETQRELAIQAWKNLSKQDFYRVHCKDIAINLFNMGDQRILDVRFPIVNETPHSRSTGDHAYWTNHPECVRKTWVEHIKNPPVKETERWFHIEFDLTSLLGDY